MSTREKWTIFVGLVVLVAFIGLFCLMVNLTDTKDDLRWTRMIYLYGSAEAIVFAFIGWLFGREVHRERAQSAEAKAESAVKDSDAAKKQVTEEAKSRIEAETRGKALAAAVRHFEPDDDGDEEDDDGTELLGGNQRAQRQATQRGLAGFANELFPPS